MKNTQRSVHFVRLHVLVIWLIASLSIQHSLSLRDNMLSKFSTARSMIAICVHYVHLELDTRGFEIIYPAVNRRTPMIRITTTTAKGRCSSPAFTLPVIK